MSADVRTLLATCTLLVGVVLVCYFWRKIYWGYADPLRFSGWLWLCGLLLSLGVFGYGLYLFLDPF